MAYPAALLAIAAVMLVQTEAFICPSGGLHLAGLARSTPSPSSLSSSSSSKNLGMFAARTDCSRTAKHKAGREARAAATGHRMAVEGEIVVHDAMPTIEVLRDACRKAKRAVTESNGEGTESSGSGRFEWGTWIDTDLRNEVRDSVEKIGVKGSAELWPALWDACGGKRRAARLAIAKGKDWSMQLHIFMSEKDGEKEESFQAQYPTGSLTYLKPLLGMTRMTKMRKFPDGRVVPLGSAVTLKGPGIDGSALGGQSVDSAQLLLGGPLHELASVSGPSLLLEVLMLPPMGLPESGDFVGVPVIPSEGIIISSFVDLEALEEDAAPPPPPASAEEKSFEAAAVDGTRNAALETATKLSENVGGLEAQLDAIVRRVLASRADPKSARALGIGHVRGVLLSGPPGCGKTLLARELARSLGAREPQIVNGPEILDKFVGEAERRVRELFQPAEAEWASAGDASALHVIILDEMDSIARKRGSLGGDTSGVRDSVVNQLLAKMDGVNQAENFIVIGLTNRPELIDSALLRPGRLEVQLSVELPDLKGRRDILRIHTRAMRAAGALGEDAKNFIDSLEEGGLPATAEHFSGAELAGLVRSAASFSLSRSVLESAPAKVTKQDLVKSLSEVTPASGKRDDELARRFASHGVSPPSPQHRMLMQELSRLVAPSSPSGPPRVQSVLLSSAGHGSGVTAIASWCAGLASSRGTVDYARLITASDVMQDGGGIDLRACFSEARGMRRSVLILDDIDRMVAGTGSAGASPAVIGTLRALLREPLPQPPKTGRDAAQESKKPPPAMIVIGTSSDPSAACKTLEGIFETVYVVPLIEKPVEASASLRASPSLGKELEDGVVDEMGVHALKYGPIGVKDLVNLAERAVIASDDAAAPPVTPLEAPLRAAAAPSRSPPRGEPADDLYSLCEIDLGEEGWEGLASARGGTRGDRQAEAFRKFVDDRQKGIEAAQASCKLW